MFGKPGHWSACCPSLQRFNSVQSSKRLSDIVSGDVWDPQFTDQSSAHLNFLQDPCEQYEFTSDQNCVSLKGRLHRALNFWEKFIRHSLFRTLSNSVRNYHFFKSQRLFQLEIIPPHSKILLFLKAPFLISSDKVVLLKFSRNLSPSILCPFLFRNLAKSVLF